MIGVAELQQAIDYIEANLSHRISLDMVGRAAHYSKFHLHHRFSQALGMTIRAYTQRRQLTEAAKLLAFSDKPVLDVALSSGYASQQAFHQAFSTMYKRTPGQFRRAGKFYPLQWKYELADDLPEPEAAQSWHAETAHDKDIPCWMGLVRLVIDGFPHFDEASYRDALARRIATREALIIKDHNQAIAVLGFSRAHRRIDFLGVHPLYRRAGALRALLDKATSEGLTGREISLTTFRAGDRADTGQRQQITELGFTEAELLVEHGYPTQRFVLSAAPAHE